MHRLKNRGIVVLTVIGLFAFSGIAMADEHEETEPAEDTVFNFGYVEDEQFLIWNVSSIDYELEEPASFEELETTCSVDGQIYEFTYEVDPDSGEVTLLTIEAVDDPTEDPVEGVECGEFNLTQVTGPEGQINHGMFLKAFNEAYEGEGRGCLVRHLAQSSLGIDNQLTVEEAAELVLQFDGEGEVTFESHAADCIHGSNDDDDDNGKGKGKPDWAGKGKPPWAGGPGGPHSQNS